MIAPCNHHLGLWIDLVSGNTASVKLSEGILKDPLHRSRSKVIEVTQLERVRTNRCKPSNICTKAKRSNNASVKDLQRAAILRKKSHDVGRWIMVSYSHRDGDLVTGCDLQNPKSLVIPTLLTGLTEWIVFVSDHQFWCAESDNWVGTRCSAPSQTQCHHAEAQ